MELLIIFILILLNGVFSMSEMSLVSSRRFKLENARKKGSTGAKSALELSENPTRYLSTVQIGITLIGILLGVYSGDKLTNDVQIFLEQFSFFHPYANNLAVAIVVIFVTYLSIVFGELLPKRLGMAFPESISILLSPFMKVISTLSSPFVTLLTVSNNLLLRLMGIKKISQNKITEEEIKSIIKESADEGEIQDIEHNIVERVFELGDRRVNSLFTHRSDIVYFTTTDSLDEIKLKIHQEKHSAYPVSTSTDLDDIIGIVLLKDLFVLNSEKDFDIRQYMRKPIFINDNAFAYKVLEIFKKEKIHYGIVVDEYGTTLGMITMDDVVDALVGDVTEMGQDEYKIVQRDENSWFVDGQYSINEFVRFFGIQLEEEANYQFSTVAGLIIYRKDDIPDIGDKISVDNYVLEVIDKDGQRIDKILVTRV
ncbi:MAG: HlyC/CorC family transporter [Saprospiraceae bacterium]|nr:HlyC/CorC family transporter [Saprospiraceae bacterium]